MSAKGLGVWVKTEEDSFVNQWVLLLGPRSLLYFLASRTDHRLDFIAVDQPGDVWVRDLGRWKAKKKS